MALAGHTAGVSTLDDLEAVPARHRVDTQLDALAARRGSPVVLDPDVDVAEIAAQIRLHGGIAVVEEENHPVGVVTTLELGRTARLTALGWRTAPHRPWAGDRGSGLGFGWSGSVVTGSRGAGLSSRPWLGHSRPSPALTGPHWPRGTSGPGT